MISFLFFFFVIVGSRGWGVVAGVQVCWLAGIRVAVRGGGGGGEGGGGWWGGEGRGGGVGGGGDCTVAVRVAACCRKLAGV